MDDEARTQVEQALQAILDLNYGVAARLLEQLLDPNSPDYATEGEQVYAVGTHA